MLSYHKLRAWQLSSRCPHDWQTAVDAELLTNMTADFFRPEVRLRRARSVGGSRSYVRHPTGGGPAGARAQERCAACQRCPLAVVSPHCAGCPCAPPAAYVGPATVRKRASGSRRGLLGRSHHSALSRQTLCKPAAPGTSPQASCCMSEGLTTTIHGMQCLMRQCWAPA